MMKQFTDSVTTQAATLAALSTKTNSSGGNGQNIDKTKAIPGLHVCAQCKRGVYHKEVNCLKQEANQVKRYTGERASSLRNRIIRGVTLVM